MSMIKWKKKKKKRKTVVVKETRDTFGLPNSSKSIATSGESLFKSTISQNDREYVRTKQNKHIIINRKCLNKQKTKKISKNVDQLQQIFKSMKVKDVGPIVQALPEL